MTDRIRSYLELSFENAPKTRRMEDLKEELYANLVEKYKDQINRGLSEEDAYNTVIRGIGDIDELIDSVRGPSAFEPQPQRQSGIRAIATAVAVMLYIISPLFVILIQDVAGLALMFVVIAIATGLLIFNHMTRRTYERMDDTLVEEFKEFHVKTNRQQDAFHAFKGAFWSLTVAIYLLVSFIFGIWAFSWIIFIIAAAIENIIKGVLALKE